MRKTVIIDFAFQARNLLKNRLSLLRCAIVTYSEIEFQHEDNEGKSGSAPYFRALLCKRDWRLNIFHLFIWTSSHLITTLHTFRSTFLPLRPCLRVATLWNTSNNSTLMRQLSRMEACTGSSHKGDEGKRGKMLFPECLERRKKATNSFLLPIENVLTLY